MILSVPKVFCFLFLFTSLVSSLNSDGLSLLALKAAVETDPTRSLSRWSESDSTPCHWPGIACTHKRVTSIFLPNKGLTGYIPSELGLLDSLTQLSLAQNNFSKPIPIHLFNATSLTYIDLSHNSLSGSVPEQIKSLQNLTHLDLSSNSLNGSLPESLVELKSLRGTLNLSCNEFSGEIPASYGEFPVMISLDLRHNNLTGKVPQIGSLVNQGPTAFTGNPNLCGFPLGNICPEAQNPRAILNPEENPENPKGLAANFNDGNGEKEKRKIGSVAVPLIFGVSVVIGAVSVIVWVFRRKWKSGEGKMGKEKMREGHEVDFEGQDGKFVVLDEGFGLELEDLLRASAYVVGKSRSGIVYRVVAGTGSNVAVGNTVVVAVRRLSEGDAPLTFKEFEGEVEAIGRVNHPNVVRLRAYYYANDEKLVVTDFIRNGSLYGALHGQSDNQQPLSWAARLRIIQGTARGLTYIHEYSPRKYVHGNLKSTKILLENELQPYISGFGLTRLVPGTSKYASSITKKLNSTQTIATSAVTSRISTPNPYLAPEARVYGSMFTQKCDVYSFGIVLLEILTGLPDAGPENDENGLEGFVRKAFREERPLSEIIDPTLLTEVYAKKQVVAAFHIALNCTELDQELRPKMRTVSESLDRIKLQ